MGNIFHFNKRPLQPWAQLARPPVVYIARSARRARHSMAQRVEREKVAEEGDLVNRQVISGMPPQKPGPGRFPGTSKGPWVPCLLMKVGAKTVKKGPKKAWKVHSEVLPDEDDEAEDGEGRENLNRAGYRGVFLVPGTIWMNSKESKCYEKCDSIVKLSKGGRESTMKMLARKGFRTKELPDSMCEKGIRRSPCGVA